MKMENVNCFKNSYAKFSLSYFVPPHTISPSPPHIKKKRKILTQNCEKRFLNTAEEEVRKGYKIN